MLLSSWQLGSCDIENRWFQIQMRKKQIQIFKQQFTIVENWPNQNCSLPKWVKLNKTIQNIFFHCLLQFHSISKCWIPYKNTFTYYFLWNVVYYWQSICTFLFKIHSARVVSGTKTSYKCCVLPAPSASNTIKLFPCQLT